MSSLNQTNTKSNTYVPGFDYDIFVSYARRDDVPVKGIPLGWVSHLVHTLEINLAQELPQYKLWMDTKQDEEKARLTSEIIPKVQKSATFLMILSPGYTNSQWCRDELKCFLDQISVRPDGSHRQIFLVRKTIRLVKIPKALEKNIFYELWYKDDNKRIRTWGLPSFRPEEVQYYNTIQDIGYDIVDELIRLKGENNDESSI